MLKFAVAAGIACALATPAYAQDDAVLAGLSYDRSGIRVESRAAIETPIFSGDPTDGETFALGRGMTLGWEGGYDLPVTRRLTVGPYATFERSNLENCDGKDCIWSRGTISGGLHVAYMRGEKTSYYAKIGYARLALEADVWGQQLSDSNAGVQIALGYEHVIADAIYVRMEGGYADNGRIFAVDFQRYHSAIGVGMRF